MRPTFDLQSHSLHSDGALPVAEVVARAAAAGVKLLALTDHDTVDGVDEALAAGRVHGIRISRAAEISSLDELGEDLHVLGYEIDHSASVLLDALENFRADRIARARRMVAALSELGFAVDETALDARRAQSRSIGRPHLARAVFEHPANAARLRDEGHADPTAVLVAYLTPGAPAFVPRTFPTVAQAVDLIHDAGGVAVWAHPFWDLDHDDEVLDTIDRFAALGIDGVEVFYASHTEHQTRVAHQRATALGLLTTGSADFHAPDHPHFDGFLAFELHGLKPDLGPIGAADL